jgi:RimJ/RimL family protein N-acetyltransferase
MSDGQTFDPIHKRNISRIWLRPAVFKDVKMVFEWRSDPFIVKHGSSQQAVRWQEHLEWFKKTVKGDIRKMFIIEKDEHPIGQVRFDRLDEERCIISIYLLQEFTNKGYGVEAIYHGCLEIFKLWNVQKVIACVRFDNLRAKSAFLKAKFIAKDVPNACAKDHFTLVLSR